MKKAVFLKLDGKYRFVSYAIEKAQEWTNKSLFGMTYQVIRVPKRWQPTSTELI